VIKIIRIIIYKVVRKMNKRTLAMMIIGILLIGLLAVSCVELEYKDPEDKKLDKEINFNGIETFAEGFAITEKIDEKYGASFKKEKIGGPLVKMENIEPMQIELDKFLTAMEADENTVMMIRNKTGRTEQELLILFIAGRITMLEAEKEFQMGYKYGNAGLVGDGFYCTEKPMILESMQHFKNAIDYGFDAQGLFDLIQSGHEELWVYIGVDENRPEFYDSPLKLMNEQIAENRDYLDENCPTGKEKIYVTFNENSQTDVMNTK